MIKAKLLKALLNERLISSIKVRHAACNVLSVTVHIPIYQYAVNSPISATLEVDITLEEQSQNCSLIVSKYCNCNYGFDSSLVTSLWGNSKVLIPKEMSNEKEVEKLIKREFNFLRKLEKEKIATGQLFVAKSVNHKDDNTEMANTLANLDFTTSIVISKQKRGTKPNIILEANVGNVRKTFVLEVGAKKEIILYGDNKMVNFSEEMKTKGYYKGQASKVGLPDLIQAIIFIL